MILLRAHVRYLFPLFQWHACKLAISKRYEAKCMTTINSIYIFPFYLQHFLRIVCVDNKYCSMSGTKDVLNHGLWLQYLDWHWNISLTVSIVLILPSSGGLNHVEFGQDISNFMSPTRIAAPWYSGSSDSISFLSSSSGAKSMLRRISVLGEGLPFEIVSHTSKPSTGTGELSSLPPRIENIY